MGNHADPESQGGIVMAARERDAGSSNASFQRLLADYEGLCRDENTALRAEDFDSLAGIQALKSEVFKALEKSGRDAGVDPTHPPLRERFEKLAAGERANSAFLSQLLAGNVAERKSLGAARMRLRAFLHSYVATGDTAGGSFLAVG